MDFITQIIGYLGDIEKYFEYFVNLATNFPLLAVLISLPVITVLFYTLIERALDFIDKLKSQTSSLKNKILLLAILLLSTFLSILFVNIIVQAKTVRPIFLDDKGEIIDLKKNELQPIELIGENISLNWKYEGENELKTKLKKENKELRYEIERSETINFEKPKSKSYGFSANNQIEIEGEFNQTLYWRVTPGYLTGNKQNRFKKLSPPSSPLSITQYSSIVDRIDKEKKLRVCTSRTSDRGFLSYIPKGNLSSSTADSVGLEPQLIKIFANKIFSNIVKDQGKIEFINLDWSKIFEETSQGKCDMAISSISITNEREQKYNLRFSEPYYETNLALIANKKIFKVSSINRENLLETLQGKKVGVLGNSTSLETIKVFNKILKHKYPNYNNRLIQIESYPRVEKALNNLGTPTRRLDFVLADKVYTDSFLFKDDTLGMVYELKPSLYPPDFSQKFITESYGVALNYTVSDILEEIDKTIEKLKANNVLDNMIAEHEKNYNKIAMEKSQDLNNIETRTMDTN